MWFFLSLFHTDLNSRRSTAYSRHQYRISFWTIGCAGVSVKMYINAAEYQATDINANSVTKNRDCDEILYIFLVDLTQLLNCWIDADRSKVWKFEKTTVINLLQTNVMWRKCLCYVFFSRCIIYLGCQRDFSKIRLVWRRKNKTENVSVRAIHLSLSLLSSFSAAEQ